MDAAGDRRNRLKRLYASDLRTLAFRTGEVWMTECGRSVAVWLPAGAFSTLSQDERLELDTSARSALGARLEIVDEIDTAVAAVRPPADWHLVTMGMLPHVQGCGLGTAVLQPQIAALDRTSATAVLKTSDTRNVRFYSRLGFEIVAELRPTAMRRAHDVGDAPEQILTQSRIDADPKGTVHGSPRLAHGARRRWNILRTG